MDQGWGVCVCVCAQYFCHNCTVAWDDWPLSLHTWLSQIGHEEVTKLRVLIPFGNIITTETLIHTKVIRIPCSWLWPVYKQYIEKLWLISMARLIGALNTGMKKSGFISLMDSMESMKMFEYESKRSCPLGRFPRQCQGGWVAVEATGVHTVRRLMSSINTRVSLQNVCLWGQAKIPRLSMLSVLLWLPLQLMVMHTFIYLCRMRGIFQSRLHVLSSPHRDKCDWQFGTYCLYSDRSRVR